MPSATIYHHRAHCVARVALTLATLASSLLSSCRASDTLAVDERTVAVRKVEHLELVSPSGSVNPGETLQMTANATDHSGLPIAAPALGWWSSSPAIATVGPTGLVLGLTPGSARITASTGAITASIDIAVCRSSGTLHVVGPMAVPPGGSASFELETEPGACVVDAGVAAWTSSDPTIASIDAAGILSALRVGRVTLSATRHGVTATAQVVVTASPGQIAYVEAGTLMRMPLDGAPSAIVQRDGSRISTAEAAISPNGSTVVFECPMGICYSAVEGGEIPLTIISGGKSPSWGSNGFAVAAWTNYAEIGIADVESGRVDHVRTPRYAQRPRLSPDGTEVAFECDYSDPYGDLSDICIISVRSGVLLAVIENASTVAWSPNGVWLAYARDGLCVAPRSEPTRCLRIAAPRNDERVIEAAWSPEGDRLVLTRSDGLWIVWSDGTGLTRIHASASPISSPSWGLGP